MIAKHQVVPVFKDHAALDMCAVILEHASYYDPNVEMEVVEVVEEEVVAMDSYLFCDLILYRVIIVPNIFSYKNQNKQSQ